ncbi:LapA family protein [Sphingobacterium hungaricum]
MKPKSIFAGLFIAFILIVLFNNKEEASFWLFGDIRTSKLFIIGAFFVLGVITGGLLFSRKKSHPKEYGVSNPNVNNFTEEQKTDNLSEEDRKYLSND